MATDVERLVVTLEASITKYDKALRQALASSQQNTDAIDKQFQKLQKSVQSRMNSIGKSVNDAFANIGNGSGLTNLLTGITGALGVNEVIKYADAWTSAKNALAVAGVTGDAQKQTLDALFQSAQKNATPLQDLVTLYGRVAQTSKDLGASQQDLLKFTDGVGTALRVAGVSSEQASGALLQLSQLLATGTVHAQEFNSVNENARPILQAVANGLKEAGGSVTNLRNLMLAGKLSSKQFFDAFLTGLPSIEGKLGNSLITVGQALTQVNNAMIKFVGGEDEATGATRGIVQGLTLLSEHFSEVANIVLNVAGVIAGALVGRSIASMIAKFGEASVAILGVVKALRQAQSVGQAANALGGLSAAAGPIGAVVGVAAAGAVLYFSEQALEASARTDRLNDDFQKLGLTTAPAVTKSLTDAGAALANLSQGEAARKLADVNAELDRIRNGGAIFGGGALDFDKGAKSLNAIQNQADQIGQDINNWFSGKGAPGDNAALSTIKEVAVEVAANSISLTDAQAKISGLANTDISQPVVDLNTQLQQTITQLQNVTVLQQKLGGADPAVGKFQAQLSGLVDSLHQYQDAVAQSGNGDPINPAIITEIQGLIKAFVDGQTSAAETKAAIQDIGNANPQVGGIIGQINAIIGSLGGLISSASAARAALSSLNAPVSGPDSDKASRATLDSTPAIVDKIAAIKASAAADTEENKLLKAQHEIQTQLGADADIRLVKALALAKVQGDERRKAENAKPKAAAKGPVNSPDDKLELNLQQFDAETAALKVNSDSLFLNTEERTRAVETAKLEAEQLEKLRKAKGIDAQLSDEQVAAIQKSVDARAKQVAADELAARSLQQLKDLEQGLAEAGFDFFDGLIDGSKTFKESVDDLVKSLAKMALQAALLGTGPLASLFGGTSQSKGGVGGIFGGLASLLGFSEGGFTGNGSRNAAAGFVHKGEYVLDADTTKKIGVANLDALRQGLRGFKDGGLVTGIPSPVAVARAANGNQKGSDTFAFSIDARGATRDSIPLLQQQIFKLRQDIPGIVLNARKRGAL